MWVGGWAGRRCMYTTQLISPVSYSESVVFVLCWNVFVDVMDIDVSLGFTWTPPLYNWCTVLIEMLATQPTCPHVCHMSVGVICYLILCSGNILRGLKCVIFMIQPNLQRFHFVKCSSLNVTRMLLNDRWLLTAIFFIFNEIMKFSCTEFSCYNLW